MLKLTRRIVAKMFEVLAGTLFLLPVTQFVWRQMSRHAIGQAGDLKVAIVAHTFYPQLVAEIVHCWEVVKEANGGRADLLITTTAELADQLRLELGERAGLEVHTMANRGRDIAPFVSLLNKGVLDRYDAVLKLHTKRSPHLMTGNLRRRLLFAVLVGHAANVRRTLALFEDRSIGIVGWRLSFRRNLGWWMGNKARIAELARRTVPPLPPSVGFFEGSMFWVRPQALAPLKALSLSTEDFELEERQVDGALHHAIERVFTLAAWAEGYSVRSLRGTVLTPGPAS